MKELIIFIIFVAISIVSERRKAKKKEEAQRKAATTVNTQTTHDSREESYEDGEEDIEDEEDETTDDEQEEEQEDVTLAERQEEEERKREEREKIKQILEQINAGRSAALHQQQQAQAANATRKADNPPHLPDEGERSTADAETDAIKPNDTCELTADDARKAVILDAIFHRPEI